MREIPGQGGILKTENILNLLPRNIVNDINLNRD